MSLLMARSMSGFRVPRSVALAAAIVAGLFVAVHAPAAEADTQQCKARSEIPWRPVNLKARATSFDIQVQACVVRWTNRRAPGGDEAVDRLKTWANVYWRPRNNEYRAIGGGHRRLHHIELVVELHRMGQRVARQALCARSLWERVNYQPSGAFTCAIPAPHSEAMPVFDVRPGTGVGEFRAFGSMGLRQGGPAGRFAPDQHAFSYPESPAV